MPRRGGLPLFKLRCRAVILRCEARCRERSGYQQGRINKGRSPQNCIERGWVSVQSSGAILRDDELNMFNYRRRRARRSLATSLPYQREVWRDCKYIPNYDYESFS